MPRARKSVALRPWYAASYLRDVGNRHVVACQDKASAYYCTMLVCTTAPTNTLPTQSLALAHADINENDVVIFSPWVRLHIVDTSHR